MCPLLRPNHNYEITSPRTPEYNCLAWALGIDWAWMQHDPKSGYYWFPGVEREWSVTAIKKLFVKVGYKDESTDATLENGFEKVAFFLEEDGSPLHFAKQLPDGRWSSKLGRSNDIAHNSLEDLEGDDSYGRVGLFLKRTKIQEGASTTETSPNA